MKTNERAELHRQGAKAAARGDDLLSHPLERHANLPAVTGESLDLWLERRDAWLAGFRRQGHVRP
jgi:hypothetical protein